MHKACPACGDLGKLKCRGEGQVCCIEFYGVSVLILWVELCPLQKYVEVVTSSTSGCDLFGNKIFTDVTELR